MTGGTCVVRDPAEREAGDPEQEDGAGARRLFDIVFATCGLLLVLPAFLVIALAVYLEGGAPVFFCQTRIGLNGRPFSLYKFRKFAAAESTNGLAVTLVNDPRLTRVGRVLERTKLDELPQLWNVIRGDMALVGPRPESLNFADCFTGQFCRLVDHKPGIFGPAQAQFRNESDYYGPEEDPEQLYRRLLFPAKAAIDLRYYATRTLWRDIVWIWHGIAAAVNLTAMRLDDDPMSALHMPDSMQLASGLGLDSGSTK
jgi:lipopolysaccharide/colanic/teichoic acid biosynthesis glycosyltransferase